MAEMETMIGGAFARVLAENRERFNAQFAAVTRIHQIDAEDFNAVLRRTLTPIVESVDRTRPERTMLVADKLFPLALELVGKKLLGPGAKQPLIEEAWRRIFVASPHLLALATGQFAGVVTNAMHNLSLTPNVRLGEWIGIMSEAAPLCGSLEEFRNAGHVAAWRCGMAHFRETALKTADSLPLKILEMVLQTPPEISVTHELMQLRNNPWHHAGLASSSRKELAVVAAPGAFRGFGGQFISPPRVILSEGRFVVADDENSWTLHADAFGATFIPLGKTDFAGVRQARGISIGASIDKTGTVQFAGEQTTFPAFSGHTSLATDGRTLAITVAFSHSVYLLAVMPKQND
jgi:hypothetical protein